MLNKVKHLYKKLFGIFEVGDLVEWNDIINHYEEECGFDWDEDNWKLAILLEIKKSDYYDYVKNSDYDRITVYVIEDQKQDGWYKKGRLRHVG